MKQVILLIVIVCFAQPSMATTGITGRTGLCVNTTTKLSNETKGGTWKSSNDAVATIQPNTGEVTGISTGSIIITYMVGNNVYSIFPLSVYPIASAINGNSSICKGEKMTLATDAVGGEWISSRPSVLSVDSETGAVKALSKGSATITYSLGGNCITTKSIDVDDCRSGK